MFINTQTCHNITGLNFFKKRGGGASLKAQPLCCQSNAFPLSCPFSTALGRPLFNSIRRVTARLRSLISSGCPYRESTAQRITGRRWPNRRREAGRTAATLDELLIWTNREAVGGVLGQQEIQRWKAAEVFCYEALTAVTVCVCAAEWPARALFFLSKRWKLIKVSEFSSPLVCV